VSCGYLPRAAIDTEQVSEPRITKIVKSIKESKYSIHDLCRCAGAGEGNLARFNMPLELGIAMGERLGKPVDRNHHDWLVLVPTGHIYAKFISDLAGYDPKQVEQKVEQVVPAIMAWLSTRDEAVRCPTPDLVLQLLPTFARARLDISTRWRGHEPWRVVVE